MQSVGEYKIIQEIGKGSFATVYRAQQDATGILVAIKSVSKSKLNRKLQENLDTEIQILKEIKHPNIVGLYSVIQTPNDIHLIMEYCALGDLSIFIKKKGEIIDGGVKICLGGHYMQEGVVRHFLGQIACALEFLRSKSVIHRDLKPQNILLSPSLMLNWAQTLSEHQSDVTDYIKYLPILKLADFGFARPLAAMSLASTLCGSPLYMAPEILRGDRYDAKADLWSLGAILYELLTSQPPFRAQNHIELLRKIERGDGWIRFPGEALDAKLQSRDHGNSMTRQASAPRKSFAMPGSTGQFHAHVGSLGSSPQFQLAPAPYFPEDIKDLIRRLLKRDRMERMSFEEFFLHPSVVQFRTIETKLTNFPSPKRPPVWPGPIAETVVQKPKLPREFTVTQMVPVIASSHAPLDPPFANYGNKPLIFEDVLPVEFATGIGSPLAGGSSIGSGFSSFEFTDEDNPVSKPVAATLHCEERKKGGSCSGSDEFQVVDQGAVEVIWHPVPEAANPLQQIRKAVEFEPGEKVKTVAFIASQRTELFNTPSIEHQDSLKLRIFGSLRSSAVEHPIQNRWKRLLAVFSLPFMEKIVGNLDRQFVHLLIHTIAAQELHQFSDSIQKSGDALSVYLFTLSMYDTCMNMAKTIFKIKDPVLLANLNVVVGWNRQQFKVCLSSAEISCSEEGRHAHDIVYAHTIELVKKAAHLELLRNPECISVYQKSILFLEALVHDTSGQDRDRISGVLDGVYSRWDGLCKERKLYI